MAWRLFLRKDFMVSAKTGDVSEALAVSFARKGIAGFSEQYRTGVDPEKQFDEMKSSEDKFRVMANTIPALVWCTLPNGSNEFHNQRWHDYTGLPEGAEQGWGWKVAYHPEDLERLLNEFQQ